MDAFIDKLAQKFLTQESGKNNGTSNNQVNNTDKDKKIKELMVQVEKYENLLNEIQASSRKNSEITEELDKITKESRNFIDEYAKIHENEMNRVNEGMSNQEMESMLGNTNDFIHSESVKVYRNVQAVVNAGFEKQAEEIGKQLKDEIKGGIKAVKSMTIIVVVLTLINLLVSIGNILGLL